MITYPTGVYGFRILFRLHGSAVFKSLTPALLSSVVYVILYYTTPELTHDPSRRALDHPYTIGALVSAFTFLLAFRANFSYNRYWEAMSSVYHMHSKWLDVGTQLAAFHLQSKIYERQKPPTFAARPEVKSLERERERIFGPTPEEFLQHVQNLEEEQLQQERAGTLIEQVTNLLQRNRANSIDDENDGNDENNNDTKENRPRSSSFHVYGTGTATTTASPRHRRSISVPSDFHNTITPSAQTQSQKVAELEPVLEPPMEPTLEPSTVPLAPSLSQSSYSQATGLFPPPPPFPSELPTMSSLSSSLSAIKADAKTNPIPPPSSSTSVSPSPTNKNVSFHPFMTKNAPPQAPPPPPPPPQTSSFSPSSTMSDSHPLSKRSTSLVPPPRPPPHSALPPRSKSVFLPSTSTAATSDSPLPPPAPTAPPPHKSKSINAMNRSTSSSVKRGDAVPNKPHVILTPNEDAYDMQPSIVTSKIERGGLDSDTPTLFLQEAAHLLSLFSAVAMSTLRNDLEEAETPLIPFTPGAPWPHVDPDSYAADIRKGWTNSTHRSWTILQYLLGWSRTDANRTLYNAARPFRVIGGVSDAEIQVIQSARGPFAKVALCSMWLQEFMTREYLAGSMGATAPPILSRLYQNVSDGMLAYNQARKVVFIPFPFAHAQITSLFVLVIVGFTPVLMLSFVKKIALGFLLNLMTVMCFTGLHEVARELESPFQNVPNDIPANNIHSQYNEALMTMFSGYHPDAFWQIAQVPTPKVTRKKSGPPTSSTMFRKEYKVA